MSDKELNKYLKKMDKLKAKVTKSEEASRQFLRDMGVITQTGRITKKYKDLCITPDQA